MSIPDIWIGKKFKLVKNINVGYVRLGDNAKREVVGWVSITISSYYDIIKVYLVNKITHNLFSISNYVLRDLKSNSMLSNAL